MKQGIMLALLSLLAACEQVPDPLKAERGELRHRYFVECLALLPAGPLATRNVVRECDNVAWHQANQVLP